MAKASTPGQTKTRLAPPLTFAEAAAFNTAFLQDVADNMLAAQRACPIVGYMAYAPPGAEPFFRQILPEAIGLIEASLPDFGDCLYKTIEALFARGHAGAVVLNSDSPTLPTSLIVETAEWLARPGDRAVLGPTVDGGYYLLGLKQKHRRLFEDITWSTEHVARQTLERAREIGLAVHVLPAWYDIDDAEALRMLYTELCEGGSFAPRLDPHRAPHSARMMHSLIAETDLAARLRRAPAADAQRAAE
jgi:rSAM/selenodomain-associated transferase 1